MTRSARKPTGPGKNRSGKADEKQAALTRAARRGG